MFGVTAVRRSSQGPRDEPDRELRNSSVMVLTGAELLLGVTERVETSALKQSFGASKWVR